MLKKLFNLNDKDKNNKLVVVIKNGLIDLKKKLKKCLYMKLKLKN